MQKEKYTNLVPEIDSWLLPRENGMLLSDYHVQVLEKNNIEYLKCNNLKELLFLVNEVLRTSDDEELEQVAIELDERDYYSN